MATSSSSLRLFCSLPNLLVFSLNLLLLLISTASFIPLLLLRTPPSSFGWALLAVSSTTLFSSLLSFFHLTHSNLYFIVHLSLLLISSIGQTLSFFSLFLRPGPCLTFLGSSKSNREVRLLVMIEEGAIVGMFVLSSVALVLECFVQSWRVKEYEEEEEEVADAKKRNRRMGKFRVESVVDVEAQEEEERMKIKREEGVKTGHYRIAKF
ncbi:uncharacterized protein A4U43_C03F13000 [Asparagus officinalis]|uniref:Uncharacterized protein n=1 Tax=Asparagus officinalis TaxID=4686 RepID=A0A5P1FET5_ASPOF|nr:uncharacterized protein LOC109832178 [Asparagus officinalis]ONK75070.1 uncharacterized protein A4U43_C03F13000 [Asparagus officinalis]